MMDTNDHSNVTGTIESNIVTMTEILAKTVSESTEEELIQLSYIPRLALKNIEDRCR